MIKNPEKFKKGYSSGVGGVVIYRNNVLLVRRVKGEDMGEWAIPGGFVEQHETIDDAVKREILEETGVETDLRGLIGVRNRLYKDENSAYFIFLLDAENDNVKPQKSEVNQVKFFSQEEIENLENLQSLSKIIITKVLMDKAKVLRCAKQNDFPDEIYSIFD